MQYQSSIDLPRQLLRVILDVLSVTDIEDEIQLFESEILGLGEQEVAVYPAEDVPRDDKVRQLVT